MKAHHHVVAAASAETPSPRQRLFSRYVISILVDLVVLNLLAAVELVTRIYRRLP